MDDLTRRGLMSALGVGVAGAAAAGALGNAASAGENKGSGMKGPGMKEMNTPAMKTPAGAKGGKYVLPDLPYSADALEPHLDAATLAVHREKHHAGYVNGLNATIEKLDAARKAGDFSNIQALSRALAFHGSGHVLHTLYFSNLAPDPGPPEGALAEVIEAQFGGLQKLVDQLSAASAKVAGSGWGMLAHEPAGGRLLVLQIEKHENQMLCGAAPLCVIDVWEHAYYLKYKNKRGDYLKEIMKVVDWREVSKRYDLVK